MDCIIFCNRCGNEYTEENKNIHNMFCDERFQKCKRCNKFISIREISDHDICHDLEENEQENGQENEQENEPENYQENEPESSNANNNLEEEAQIGEEALNFYDTNHKNFFEDITEKIEEENLRKGERKAYKKKILGESTDSDEDIDDEYNSKNLNPLVYKAERFLKNSKRRAKKIIKNIKFKEITRKIKKKAKFIWREIFDEVSHSSDSEEDNNDIFSGKTETERILNILPQSTLTADFHKGQRCVICLEDYTVGACVTTLPCTHVFHPKCIKEWLASHKECPVCKFSIREKTLMEDL